MIDLNDLELDSLLGTAEEGAAVRFSENASEADGRIAIIGMAGSVGAAESLDAFWQMIAEGRTGRRELPQERRKDFEDYLRLRGAFHRVSGSDYLKETFLEEIDKFDHKFFGLSKQEANLMDPNQRLFLQMAWSALENAGYGGESVKGTNTGVFVGFSADFGQDYSHIIQTFAPDAPEISVAGNIKSIIASRIAYTLDLRGPSMMIDTACSSGLVSVHQACRALRNNECEMVIAGAVKIDLLPIEDRDNTGVGTRDIQDTIARDGTTKTFDESCDGTSAAEGVLAFILKPLEKALNDGDYIHAVIHGSAINQDGLSVGITAPNSAAQEKLIIAALEDARAAAEDVGYIEAHGTATRLGDPIEVSGVQRAFAHYTQRKQFCAIGSVKTNIGHMDNAAGLAGLAKVVYALKHAQLPPSLHFKCPNQNIAFEKSPVFVNDMLRPWPNNSHGERLAGINSFGLSGTNCHVLAGSAPKVPSKAKKSSEFLLFVLSAKSAEQLQDYAARFHDYLNAPASAAASLKDMCFTLAIGRLQQPYRLALIINSRTQLIESLDKYLSGQGDDNLLLSIPDSDENAEAAQLALAKDAMQLLPANSVPGAALSMAILEKLRDFYIRGASIDWAQVYPRAANCKRVPLPTYPFAKSRCWVEISELARKRSSSTAGGPQKHFAHPLLDSCLVNSLGFSLYQTTLRAQGHWELADHKVKGHCILPGTAYIEMLLEIVRQQHPDAMPDEAAWELCIEKAQFMSPLAVSSHEHRNVHVQLQGEFPRYQVRIVSQAKGEWQTHAEATLATHTQTKSRKTAALDLVKSRLSQPIAFTQGDDQRRGLDIGDRWNHAFVQGWKSENKQEFLVELALPKCYREELNHYHYHPALMDVAVNAANHLLDEDQLFLPLAYRNFHVYAALPAQVYVHLSIKHQSAEMASFDVTLLNSDSQVLGWIEDYTVKRVPETELSSGASQAYAIRLMKKSLTAAPAQRLERVLIIHSESSAQLPLLKTLQSLNATVFEVQARSEATPQLLQSLKTAPLDAVVYAGALSESNDPVQLVDDLHHLGEWLSRCMREKLTLNGPFLCLTQNAMATEADEPVYLTQAAILDFARIAHLENPQLSVVVADLSEQELQANSIATLNHCLGAKADMICLRKDQLFVEQLVEQEVAAAEEFPIEAGAAYLITGGTGALGLALAHELAAQSHAQEPEKPIKLVLCGSQPLPAESEWQNFVNSNENSGLTAKLKALQSIASLGVTLDVTHANMADEAAVQQLLADIRQKHGALRGVIHAAGRAGAGFIANKTRETLQDVILPKAAGAWWLHKYSQSDALDFFVMYSSIATVLRNPGQSDYTAANRYLDALAQLRRNQGLPALSVRWPAWREIGIAVEFNAVDENEFFVPVNTEYGLARLASAMTRETPAALVLADINSYATREDLNEAGLGASESILRLLNRQRNAAKADAADDSLDVTLKGVAEPSEIQLKVAKLWRKVLGSAELAIDEQFSDLGGNSILATQLYNEYEKLHPGAMDMADLFTHTSIEAQAKQLAKVLGLVELEVAANQEEEDLDEILRRLSSGELSAEEAESML